MNLSIRPLTVADLDAADRIVLAAYKETRSRKRVLRRYFQLQPGGWLMAFAGQKPVGIVGATNYGPFAYIGMMGVLPEAQGQGVGRALLEHALVWLEQHGHPTVLLDATEQGARLYAQFGFVEEDTITHWRRVGGTLPGVLSARNQARMEFVRMTEHLSELTAFDAPIFGTGRATVFASLLLDYEGRVFLTRDEVQRITGYLFAQRHAIGPWVAENEVDAERLLRRALALPFEQPPAIFMPDANMTGRRLLEHYGFQKQRVLRHMRRGELELPRRREQIYGQTSFALG